MCVLLLAGMRVHHIGDIEFVRLRAFPLSWHRVVAHIRGLHVPFLSRLIPCISLTNNHTNDKYDDSSACDGFVEHTVSTGSTDNVIV